MRESGVGVRTLELVAVMADSPDEEDGDEEGDEEDEGRAKRRMKRKIQIQRSCQQVSYQPAPLETYGS